VGNDRPKPKDSVGAMKRTTTFVTVAVDAIAEGRRPPVGATMTVLTGGEAGRLIFVPATGGSLGRGKLAEFSFPEESISRRHAKLELVDGKFKVTDLGSLNGTFVDGRRIDGNEELPDNCRIQIATNTVIQFASVDELGAKAVEKLSRTITTDPLTGTGNRYHLQQRLDQEVHYAQRHNEPLGMLLADLDFFKAVNDEHGHLAGDAVLKSLGDMLLQSVRTEDAVFRYGGEEFCVLLRNTSARGMLVLAERIRSVVEGTPVAFDNLDLRVTISIGAALLPGDETGNNETLLYRADMALYQAKAAGRNQVVLYEGE